MKSPVRGSGGEALHGLCPTVQSALQGQRANRTRPRQGHEPLVQLLHTSCQLLGQAACQAVATHRFLKGRVAACLRPEAFRGRGGGIRRLINDVVCSAPAVAYRLDFSAVLRRRVGPILMSTACTGGRHPAVMPFILGTLAVVGAAVRPWRPPGLPQQPPRVLPLLVFLVLACWLGRSRGLEAAGEVMVGLNDAAYLGLVGQLVTTSWRLPRLYCRRLSLSYRRLSLSCWRLSLSCGRLSLSCRRLSLSCWRWSLSCRRLFLSYLRSEVVLIEVLVVIWVERVWVAAAGLRSCVLSRTERRQVRYRIVAAA